MERLDCVGGVWWRGLGPWRSEAVHKTWADAAGTRKDEGAKEGEEHEEQVRWDR